MTAATDQVFHHAGYDTGIPEILAYVDCTVSTSVPELVAGARTSATSACNVWPGAFNWSSNAAAPALCNTFEQQQF